MVIHALLLLNSRSMEFSFVYHKKLLYLSIWRVSISLHSYLHDKAAQCNDIMDNKRTLKSSLKLYVFLNILRLYWSLLIVLTICCQVCWLVVEHNVCMSLWFVKWSATASEGCFLLWSKFFFNGKVYLKL